MDYQLYTDHIFIKLTRLPRDQLALEIVNSNPLAIVGGVSDKDDFFVHTPRRTISEVKFSREVLTHIIH